MKMTRLLLILALLFAGQTALAGPDAVRTRVLTELQNDGYLKVQISRTLLGRMRFLGKKDGSRREIVANPATGEILRDYIYSVEGSSNSTSRASNEGTTSTSAASGGSGGNGVSDDSHEDHSGSTDDAGSDDSHDSSGSTEDSSSDKSSDEPESDSPDGH